jgi:hypothetical protein
VVAIGKTGVIDVGRIRIIEHLHLVRGQRFAQSLGFHNSGWMAIGL